MRLDSEFIPNGEKPDGSPFFMEMAAFECDGCGDYINEMSGYVLNRKRNKNVHFCWECGFRLRLVTADEFKKWHGCLLNVVAVFEKNGDIIFDPIPKKRKKKFNKNRQRKSITKDLRFFVFQRDNFKCRYCGVSSQQAPLQVDHVVAIANGGDHHHTNMVTACRECNLGKRDIPLTKRALKELTRGQK